LKFTLRGQQSDIVPIIETGGKFASGIVDTGGKFAMGINNNQQYWGQSLPPV
jgi:hypothetical protein